VLLGWTFDSHTVEDRDTPNQTLNRAPSTPSP
jgi:hypothetical protein